MLTIFAVCYSSLQDCRRCEHINEYPNEAVERRRKKLPVGSSWLKQLAFRSCLDRCSKCDFRIKLGHRCGLCIVADGHHARVHAPAGGLTMTRVVLLALLLSMFAPVTGAVAGPCDRASDRASDGSRCGDRAADRRSGGR